MSATPLLRLFALCVLSLTLTAVADRAAADELHPIAAEVGGELDDVEKPFVLIVKFVTNDGQADKLIDVMREPIAQTAKEDGNILYELSQSIKEPNEFVLYERWKSLDALNSHLKQPYLAKLLASLEGLLAEAPDLTVCVPVANEEK